jgi:hypothetical protein
LILWVVIRLLVASVCRWFQIESVNLETDRRIFQIESVNLEADRRIFFAGDLCSGVQKWEIN